MRLPAILRPIFSAFLLLMLPNSSWAVVGLVTSTDPMRVVRPDGSTETLHLRVDQMNLWDGRQVLVLMLATPPTPSEKGSCSCESRSLGRLDRPFSLKVRIENRDHLITVPAHRTLVYQKGDQDESSYQIDVKDADRGGIAIDALPTTTGKEAILESFRKATEIKSVLIRMLALRISQQNPAEARETYSELVSYELFSHEIKQVNSLLQGMPEMERPIRTLFGDVRPDLEELHRAFPGMNFDRMTKAEYISFFRNWALHPGLTRSADQATGDETYLFRIMDTAALNPSEQVSLLKLTLDSRIEGFLKLALAGKPVTDASFRDLYAAEMAKTWLEGIQCHEAKAYLFELRQRIGSLPDPVRAWLREALLDNSL
jgi:hypothetical protein